VSDFVNYNKRSFTLPGGCKDLAQVLARKSRSIPELKCEKLSALCKYVARAYESSASCLTLCVRPGKLVDINRACFIIQRLPGDRLEANVYVQMGTEDEAALRRFLQCHGYSAPDKSVPAQFSLELPVEMICKISPLPDEAVLCRAEGSK
jgi:hypothetical protein